MGFSHEWVSSGLRVWDKWEMNGKTWIIQDLLPEDDEKAIQMLWKDFANDEPLCAQSKITDDRDIMLSIVEYWRECLKKRTTLGCYTDVNEEKTLVGLNCYEIVYKGDDNRSKTRGRSWKNASGVIAWMKEQADAFEHIGDDKLLTGRALVVAKDFRGFKLGGRLLNAREPVCRSLGVKGTANVFTSPAAQKLAASCGFKTIWEATWADFSNAGYDYPKKDNVVKYMYKKYM